MRRREKWEQGGYKLGIIFAPLIPGLFPVKDGDGGGVEVSLFFFIEERGASFLNLNRKNLPAEGLGGIGKSLKVP